MSFEMQKLVSFPMEKLCYDLKLEVFEQMKPEDVIELVKVNSGFRSILLRTPWIVFGRHVHQIFSLDDLIFIRRRPHDSPTRLHVALHFPLFKRIHSCDVLWPTFCKLFDDQYTAILNNLNSVKRLDLTVDTNELLLKFLENFRLVIREYAHIGVKIDLLKENQVISELFKNFIANQINDCEKVTFLCKSAAAFHFYYGAFAKTSIKFLFPSTDPDDFEMIVQSIVEKGIPSKNLEAAIYVNTYSLERESRIIDFLSRFSGMKRFEGENWQKVTKIVNEIWDCRLVFTEKSVIFRRNIDSRRECVYIFESFTDERDPSEIMTDFFAFYIHPQSEKMAF